MSQKKSCLVKKKKKATCPPTTQEIKKKEKGTRHRHFCPLSSPFSPFSFLFILGRKQFGGPGEKTLRPHHLFSLLPTICWRMLSLYLRVPTNANSSFCS